MLQIIQYQKTGKLSVEDLPPPQLRPGGILVKNVASVISSGTERSSVQTAQASMVGKARSRPDLVRQVVDNVKREGLLATYEKVQNRLDNYKELGYSTAGIVVESSVAEFRAGDKVACAGVAYHAEQIFVPKNLAAKIPDGVSFESAAFTTVSAIALQGVRQAEVQLGETVCVIGTGLLGLISIQFLKAAGCRVVGIDVSEVNFALAKDLGCDLLFRSNEDALRNIEEVTKGHGADAVVITASTKSSDPVDLAMQVARKRGKVVVVGAVGMEIPRSPFYEKEIDFRISCSYGPGRYDHVYEQEGQDYPYGFVRWTENRNMEAALAMMAQGKLYFDRMISHRFAIQDALRAYDIVTGKTEEKHLAIIIQYPDAAQPLPRSEVHERQTGFGERFAAPGIGFIGAGNFAQSYLLPHIIKATVPLTGVITNTPVQAHAAMKKFGFGFCDTDKNRLFDHADTGTIFIATRHDSHGRLVKEALERGRSVFVEKPLAVTEEELDAIAEAWQQSSSRVLMTGFNRRFSSPWMDLKKWFSSTVEPFAISYRVNAGNLPKNHWLHSGSQGGRIVGEVCHFLDCMVFLTGARPVRVFCEALANHKGDWLHGDNSVTTISFSDGSVGTVTYLSNSDSSLPKEFCEIHSGGRTAIMSNFTQVTFYHNRKKSTRRYNGTKGHKEEIAHFLSVLRGECEPAMSVQSQIDVTRTTLRAVESLNKRAMLDV